MFFSKKKHVSCNTYCWKSGFALTPLVVKDFPRSLSMTKLSKNLEEFQVDSVREFLGGSRLHGFTIYLVGRL